MSAGWRRRARHRALGVSVVLACGVAARRTEAQQDALTIVAPAAPGGGWDQTARVMQQVLRETGLATQVQVVNVPGAAGTIGLARFAQAERGNPHALLVTGLVMLSGIAMNRSPVTFDDVEPLARLSGEYEVVVVPRESPFRTLDDLVTAFRAAPRAVSWGGGSAGGTDEILVRLLAAKAGVAAADVNYVAYAGGGQALASVLGGHVSAAVSGWGEFAAQVESGALRALAISAPARVTGAAVPTFREQGIDVELLNWRAVVAPRGLSPAERRRALERVRRMASSDAWQAALARNGWAAMYLEGAAFERFLRDETARVAPLVLRAERDRAGGPLVLLVLLGGTLAFAGSLIERRTTWARAPEPLHGRALALLAVALAAGTVLFRAAGFWIAATVMFVLIARAFGSRSVVRDLLVGAALVGLIHLAFTRLLGVSLPGAPLS